MNIYEYDAAIYLFTVELQKQEYKLQFVYPLQNQYIVILIQLCVLDCKLHISSRYVRLNWYMCWDISHRHCVLTVMSFLMNKNKGLSLGIKQPGHDSNYLSPASGQHLQGLTSVFTVSSCCDAQVQCQFYCTEQCSVSKPIDQMDT